jgi:hypothetical protein
MLPRTFVRLCALAACAAAPSASPAAPSPSPPVAPTTAAAPRAPSPSPAAPPAPAAPTRFLKLDGTAVEITGLGFDASHALYIAGEFRTRLVLGASSVRSAAADPRSQIFLARLSPRGDVDWLIRVGSPHPADLSAISVSPDGTVALVGHYEWAIGPDRGPVTPRQLDAFVIVVGPDGKVRWERRIDGKDRQLARAVHRTADGAVLVGGYYEAETRFGARRATSVPGPHVPSLDFFLARFSPTGDVDWVATGGGADDDRLEVGAARLGDGPAAVQLPGAPPSTALANPDRTFVASYAPTGALRWAIQTGGKDLSYTTVARALSDGSVLFHGWEQNLGGARTPYLLHVDARGAILHHRELSELGAAVADATSLVSARAAGSSLVFERHTGPSTASAAPALTVPGPALKVTALALGSDGRAAVAGTTGELTETKVGPDTRSITFENVEGYLAIAPSLSALRAR